MSKFDYKYWRKMTWDWYVLKRESYDNRKKTRNKGNNGVLRRCTECDFVYSIDSNLGSNRLKRMYKYLDVPKNGVYREICPDCDGQKFAVITY